MKDLIVIDDPATLPTVIAKARKVMGLSRWQVSRDIAAEQARGARSVNNQVALWEVGGKSPTLASLECYLRQHGWKLALVSIDDHV
jgi:hypothetical protein